MTVVTVLAHYAPAARAKLEKLQRKAARYGQVINWTETARTETRKRPLWNGKIEEYQQPLVDFDVAGEAPRVGPYRFLAAVERAPGGNLIAGVAGVEIGDLGREWDGRCEHCHAPRGRKTAYVVENTETGERKIVGKTCLRDHLGTDAPAGAIALFQWEREPVSRDDEESWGGFTPWHESTRYIIAAARAAIALWGWRPNSAADDGLTTSGYVSLLWSRGKTREANKAEIEALRAEMTLRADEYVAVADAILAWGADLQPRGDYEHNLKIALASDLVNGKTFGLVVSACAAFDKQKAIVEERAERAKREAEQAAASRHFGEVGTRYRGVELTVEGTRAMAAGQFGPTILYTLRTPCGAILKWFTGSAPRLDGKRIERGDKFVGDFSVKKHGEFRGAQETTVTRVAVK